MNKERATRLAVELLQLGISQQGVASLLAGDHDEIEQQLAYLPYRKARRPGAFLVEAVRNRYSPPKEFFYAKAKDHLSDDKGVDENPELHPRPTYAEPQGYGIESASDSASADGGLEP